MRTNLTIVSDHYAASARQDLAAMLAYVAPDVQWTEMAGFPCAGIWIGPEQVIKQVFNVLGAEWIGYKFELERLLDAGDHIIGVGLYSGVYAKTGKHMTARASHVWRLKDKKIVQFEQFTDTLLVAQAMNLN